MPYRDDSAKRTRAYSNRYTRCSIQWFCYQGSCCLLLYPKGCENTLAKRRMRRKESDYSWYIVKRLLVLYFHNVSIVIFNQILGLSYCLRMISFLFMKRVAVFVFVVNDNAPSTRIISAIDLVKLLPILHRVLLTKSS